ncbi:MAG: uroporphyrinogen-III C-methyltransferase [Proteobacteria bacterium]|nr:MAG: uroporphyrinogen-III C-methyltransferase [Pseudomonadota bacterium]
MGTVYLVGAGPGAPDLLTLRAARLLELADIVFHDALVHPEVIALSVNARKVAVGKRCSQISTDQRFINRALIEAAHRYDTVVRLKGGDPMLFGRAQEEVDALRAADVQVEIVPGVTAALAASADMGVSLTRRGLSRNVLFATPRIGKDLPIDETEAWARAVAAADTAVLYMSRGEAPGLVEALRAAGLPPGHPAAIVENASLPEGRLLFCTLDTLAEHAAQTAQGPSVVILGEVLRQALSAQDSPENSIAASEQVPALLSVLS